MRIDWGKELGNWESTTNSAFDRGYIYIPIALGVGLIIFVFLFLVYKLIMNLSGG